jgi:hypothetical protein
MVIRGDSKMVYGTTSARERIDFNVQMSFTADRKRQTLGQVNELTLGWKHRNERLRVVTDSSQLPTPSDYSECYLYRSDGTKISKRIGGEESQVKATFGRCYILPMIQVSYDRQHYTHSISGSGTMEPILRRIRGWSYTPRRDGVTCHGRLGLTRAAIGTDRWQ